LISCALEFEVTRNVGKNYLNTTDNTPIGYDQNTPLALSGQSGGCRRRYTRSQEIENLAVSKYKMNAKGITFNDLLSSKLALHKEQAQTTLKYCIEKEILFTISKFKPQRYYPVCLKAEVLKADMSKNMPVGVTGVGCSKPLLSSYSRPNDNNSCADSIAIQSLNGYVLPLLPAAPLFIHKMQFKLHISPECYSEVQLPIGKGNNGKEHVEVIGRVRASYRFYPNGTVMVFTESSNTPFKLEDETDLSSLMAFLGQVRDRLVTFLTDTHERIVPGIMQWQMTQCDINKDVKVSDWLQVTAIRVQVKHVDRLFRTYIKSMGQDTVCRVEESFRYSEAPSAIQTISNIFAIEKVDKQIEKMDRKLDLVLSFIGNHNSNNGNEENAKGILEKDGVGAI
jgi:hypothetical protein